MKIIEYQPQHLLQMNRLREWISDKPAYALMLKESGPTWTLLHHDRVIGCGGVFRDHPQCGTAWTEFTAQTGRHMLAIHRAAQRAIDSCGCRRVQAYVDPHHDAGRRWIDMLGFELEGYLKRYTPEGHDMLLFARIT